MGDSSQAPRVGSQPHNEGDHATQLLADIAALRSYRATVAQKSKTKNLPWTAINGVFESIEGYIKKSREITVKINDPNPSSQVRRATRVQIMEQVNGAISRSKHRDLQDPRIQVRAIKRHPSGDLTLYTDCKEHTDLLIKHKSVWEDSVGPKAKVVVPTYGILVHGISTELNVADTTDIENRIRKDNPSHQDARITYTGWLKKDITGKRASTMVIEFDNPQHADTAILKGLVSGSQMFMCEYYDRSCKLKQCFRCQ
jgi:hypothetical protein